jgi:hypothetical protein
MTTMSKEQDSTTHDAPDPQAPAKESAGAYVSPGWLKITTAIGRPIGVCCTRCNSQAVITVTGVQGKQVRIGFKAPRSIRIDRNYGRVPSE